MASVRDTRAYYAGALAKQNTIRTGTRAARRLSPVRRAAPGFLVIGAMKAGTTTVYDLLSRHRQVVEPLVKEVHYFDRSFERGTDWYLRNFCSERHLARVAREHGRALTFEGTPGYLFFPECPGRIHETLPGVLAIALLRDPVERAISHYHHRVRKGRETLPLRAAMEADAERGERALGDEHAGPRPRERIFYLARGNYAEQLERWYDVVGRERILVVETATLRSGGMARICDFLGIRDDDPGLDAPDRNVQEYPEPDPADVRWLERYYEDANDRLERLLGRPVFGAAAPRP